jgi:hypothetical protein
MIVIEAANKYPSEWNPPNTNAISPSLEIMGQEEHDPPP